MKTYENRVQEPKDDELIGSLRIEDLTVEGQGLARHEGRVVFVENAYPEL